MKNILKTLAIALVLVLSSCSKEELVKPYSKPYKMCCGLCGTVISVKYKPGVQSVTHQESFEARNDSTGNVKRFKTNGIGYYVNGSYCLENQPW